MSIFQLRIYTLRDQPSLAFYKDEVYPRHALSIQAFGLTVRGIWTSPEDKQHKLYVLVSGPDNADMAAIEKAYMQSREFLDDLRGMDVSAITDVKSVVLSPTAASPLD